MIDNIADICIIGTGYVGIASAVGFAELGHTVVGYDILSERIRGLAVGETPYHEPGLQVVLRKNLANGHLRFIERLEIAVANARFILLAIGTPSNDDGSADLSALTNAINALHRLNLEGKILVLRSTVPPGTTDTIRKSLGENTPMIYSPEFFREGHALHDFLHPNRLVIGAHDSIAARRYAELFDSIDVPIFFATPIEAELTKGFSNAFLATKISFANEVANFCGVIGADAPHVLAMIGADPRITSSCFAAGIGFGGPCLDKDTRSLQYVAEKIGAGNEMLNATLAVNELQPHRVIAMLERELGTLAGATIGVWGLTFKAGTDDIRNSLAIKIIRTLLGKGAHVRAYDPSVADATLLLACDVVDDPLQALDADALLLLTDWPAFKKIPAETIVQRLRQPIVIDGRNFLDHRRLVELGVRYYGIGRQVNPAGADALPQDLCSALG